MKIRILKDRLKTCTDNDMINHINKIIKEIEAELADKSTEDIKIYKS